MHDNLGDERPDAAQISVADDLGHELRFDRKVFADGGFFANAVGSLGWLFHLKRVDAVADGERFANAVARRRRLFDFKFSRLAHGHLGTYPVRHKRPGLALVRVDAVACLSSLALGIPLADDGFEKVAHAGDAYSWNRNAAERAAKALGAWLARLALRVFGKSSAAEYFLDAIFEEINDGGETFGFEGSGRAGNALARRRRATPGSFESRGATLAFLALRRVGANNRFEESILALDALALTRTPASDSLLPNATRFARRALAPVAQIQSAGCPAKRILAALLEPFPANAISALLPRILRSRARAARPHASAILRRNVVHRSIAAIVSFDNLVVQLAHRPSKSILARFLVPRLANAVAARLRVIGRRSRAARPDAAIVRRLDVINRVVAALFLSASQEKPPGSLRLEAARRASDAIALTRTSAPFPHLARLARLARLAAVDKLGKKSAQLKQPRWARDAPAFIGAAASGSEAPFGAGFAYRTFGIKASHGCLEERFVAFDAFAWRFAAASSSNESGWAWCARFADAI